jgi:hypothetical protein
VFEFCSDMSEAFLLPGLFFPMTKPADNNKKKVPAWTCSAIFHKLIRIRKPNHSYEIEGIKEQPSLNPKLVGFFSFVKSKVCKKNLKNHLVSGLPIMRRTCQNHPLDWFKNYCERYKLASKIVVSNLKFKIWVCTCVCVLTSEEIMVFFSMFQSLNEVMFLSEFFNHSPPQSILSTTR